MYNCHTFIEVPINFQFLQGPGSSLPSSIKIWKWVRVVESVSRVEKVIGKAHGRQFLLLVAILLAEKELGKGQIVIRPMRYGYRRRSAKELQAEIPNLPE